MQARKALTSCHFFQRSALFFHWKLTSIITRVFLRPFTHGGICSPQVQGDKALMGGGLVRGDIDLMRGHNFDRLYHKLKVLLLLSCNYMMQFISCDSIKLVDLYLIAFKFIQ